MLSTLYPKPEGCLCTQCQPLTHGALQLCLEFLETVCGNTQSPAPLCSGGASSLEGPIFGPPPGLITTQELKEVVVACERGTVVMLDKAMAILHRTWPLYEVGPVRVCVSVEVCVYVCVLELSRRQRQPVEGTSCLFVSLSETFEYVCV